MRGVRKPWPPKNVSPDGQTPGSMREAAESFQASLAAMADQSSEARSKHARSTFNNLDKKKLRAVLLAEQRSLCIFCERGVAETVPPPRVAHWRPINHEPEHALNWENLYLSCQTQGTCDVCQDNARLVWDEADPSLPWPTQVDYERWVGFTSTGEVYVRADASLTPEQRRALELAIADCDDNGTRRQTILNLNERKLVAARHAAITGEMDRLERNFKKRTASKEERAAIAEHLLKQTTRLPFVSTRVAYLKKMLGRGRP
jgi:uncharacterized protein (TIGR02646 family)